MNRRLLSSLLLPAAVAVISSCTLLGHRDEALAADAAAALLDFVDAQGYEQVQELEVATYDLPSGGVSGSVRGISLDVTVHEYPNVTITVTRELDDRGTATPTDDVEAGRKHGPGGTDRQGNQQRGSSGGGSPDHGGYDGRRAA